MRFVFLPALALLASFSASAEKERFIELNLGLSASKSVLGVSYTSGKNQVNVGLKQFWLQSPGENWSGFFQPGISYNRYLTSNGFYATATFAPYYSRDHLYSMRFVGPDSNDYAFDSHFKKGWHMGDLFLGAGKSFQFTHWGIHVDGGFVTPADADIARAWGYWLGAGASYRFKLD